MTESPNDTNPWGEHRLEDGGSARIDIGPLTLHLARAGDELRVAHERGDHTPGSTGAPGAGGGERVASTGEEVAAPDMEWTRWAATGWDGAFELAPTLPDRPLVVAPESTFHLTAGAQARIYVRVPLCATVELLADRNHSPVATLPTVPFSDTWWGDLEDGELAFWLTTKARRAVTDDLFEPYLVLCPLQLVNRSEEDLPVDKIALRVAYLTLYAHEGHIWSDETRVRYQGDADGSRLDVAGRPPREAPEAVEIAPPALRMARGFSARTFARLRSLPGWIS